MILSGFFILENPISNSSTSGALDLMSISFFFHKNIICFIEMKANNNLSKILSLISEVSNNFNCNG